MKVYLMLILMVLLSVIFVEAKTDYATLEVNDSFLFRGKNITLLSINSFDNKVVICINNEKAIISEDRNVNTIGVHLRDVDSDKVKFRFDNPCKDKECECDDSCSNHLCTNPEKNVELAVNITPAQEYNSTGENLEIKKEFEETILDKKSFHFSEVIFGLLVFMILILISLSITKKYKHK